MKPPKMTREVVKSRLEYPYDIKLMMAERRISSFISYYGEQGVTVSVSGGLDSLALMHFIHERYPGVSAVSVLAIECIQNIKRVLELRDTEGIKLDIVVPSMTQEKVIRKYGYPVVSKQVAGSLSCLQNPTEKNVQSRNLALTGVTTNVKNSRYKLPEKYRFLIDAPFKISNECCKVMKEHPLEVYCKKNNKASIVATRVEESALRLNAYCKRGGCNSFQGNGKSMPFSYMTKQDILRYLYENKVKVSEAYGEIVKCEDGTYKTTKAQRTGCPICMFGMQYDTYPNRFQRMYYDDNRRWKQVIFEWGYKKVLDFFIENGFKEYQYYPEGVTH